MTIAERRKYLRTMKKRYVKAGRKERAQLLDEMEAVTGLHRKSLTQLMNGSLERKPRRKQRGRIYGLERAFPFVARRPRRFSVRFCRATTRFSYRPS